MAESIILGTIAKQVLPAILQATYQIVSFREDVEQLQNTLEQLVPLFKEGKQVDLELTDQKRKGLEKFEKKLLEGEELVKKCCKISAPNIFQKYRYSRKISSLNKTIRSFCGLELQVESWRDNKLLRSDVQQMRMMVEGLTQQQGQGQGQIVGVGTLGNEGLLAVPKIPDRVVGFGMALRDLKNELFKENVTVLGLCAPGGCGKSTLAAMLCQDEEVRGKFKEIFFVNVPTTPTATYEILQTLLEKIGGGVLPSSWSEENAMKQFHYHLERKPEQLLLVLDDVWDKSVIEKFFSRTKGFKMLVTSREEFQVYNTEYHSKYHLEKLSHQDSMNLFRQTALSQDRNVGFEPEEDLLNQIVRCCDGFPLAITVIAKSLYQQHPVIWENMAKKLSKGSCILDFDENLRERLSASLDSLEKTVLDCFLDLSSFPEDKRIPASALINIWCELYELDDENEAFVILLELASRNLVNLVGSRKMTTGIVASFNDLFVTQHDLLRDLVIYQSRQRLIMYKREKGILESGRKQENHYFNPRLVYLGTGEMFVESWNDLQLPEVEVLILNFSASNYSLPPFMEKMRKLKVVIVVNRGRTCAKLSNLISLRELANVKRIRLEKVLIPSLHEFTLPLMNLQQVSLVMCDFDHALMQSTINVSYELPNLVEINIDYCHDIVELPPWICDIINLRTLSITSCDKLSALPERIGDITDLDLLRLHACTGLSSLPDSIKGLQKLRFLDISDCCDLNMLPDGIGELHCLKKLDMRGCNKLSELPPSAMNLVHLKEVICDQDTASLWEPRSSSLKINVPENDNNLDWLGVIFDN
ncbi:probable disease resistance protein At5g66900 isoform X2 [Macadamia integrifolia]|nr:probable disease resistance protein At5g66900 isoform X2 [Macadamia integrifolia]XP_042494198.1 probable disease resistance protein At5g66900 isoform X2 [Macadamia integrifolia]